MYSFACTFEPTGMSSCDAHPTPVHCFPSQRQAAGNSIKSWISYVVVSCIAVTQQEGET